MTMERVTATAELVYEEQIEKLASRIAGKLCGTS